MRSPPTDFCRVRAPVVREGERGSAGAAEKTVHPR